MSVTHSEQQTAKLAVLTLLGAASVRLVASVIAGFISLGQHNDVFDSARVHASGVLTAFGAAGDSVEVLLAGAAVAVLWWLSRHGAATAIGAARAVLLVTMLLIAARATGYLLIELDNPRGSAESAVVLGFALADALVAGGALLGLRRVGDVAVDGPPDQPEPLLFAVDRASGEVFAFLSFAQARRTISVYSIEENEYAFYTDEGDLVEATAGETGVTFTPTSDNRREQLMQSLRRFAQAHALSVEEPAEPTSYAVPIADWQWLELWPGWLRPIGRVVRRLTG